MYGTILPVTSLIGAGEKWERLGEDGSNDLDRGLVCAGAGS